jgi:hypothetical protein
MQKLDSQKPLDDATRGYLAMGRLARQIFYTNRTQRQKLIGRFVEAYSHVLIGLQDHPGHAEGVIKIKNEAVQKENVAVLEACRRVEDAYDRRPTDFRKDEALPEFKYNEIPVIVARYASDRLQRLCDAQPVNSSLTSLGFYRDVRPECATVMAKGNAEQRQDLLDMAKAGDVAGRRSVGGAIRLALNPRKRERDFEELLGLPKDEGSPARPKAGVTSIAHLAR